MVMALMVKATAYVIESCEWNCDGFASMAMNRASKFCKKDPWIKLPMVRSDRDLDFFKQDGEILCKGCVTVSATVENIEAANNVLNEFIVAAAHFGFEVGFDIIGKIIL